MSDELRDKVGYTIDESILSCVRELDADEISLHWLIATARSFDLPEGGGRDDFLRRCIVALLAAGAHPSAPEGRSSGVVWNRLDYGDLPETIADAIVMEWRRDGADPIDSASGSRGTLKSSRTQS